MKIDTVSTNSSNPNFKAKVSKNFIDRAHNFINYGYFGNKKQSIYALDQKAEQYATFGFDDYVLDYEKKQVDGTVKHYLTATRTSNGKVTKKIITGGKSLKKIILEFMAMNRDAFENKMKEH